MGNTTIIVSRPLPPAMMEALGQFGSLRVVDLGQPLPDDGDILVSTPMDPVTADVIDQLPTSLRLIANIGVGTDNIDLAAARDRGIVVSNTPVVTEDTADLTLALMLATCRRLSISERHLRAGNWTAGVAQLGQRVHGKRLGIIGFGAIGQAVAQRARGFNMEILYHGPHRKPEAEAALGARYCATLDQLLAEADIVSLNCALTEQTRHLLNAESLAKMKPGAVVINTGRGPLIDEAALVEALRCGHLGAVGLDVFEFEPEITPALREFDNVTLLPHIGSATAECRMDMARRVCANIGQFLQQGAPLDRCH
ncbi:2-hydroxyacid dehydrogenase [Marinobacterium rhizophilum]|uniref:2-hydroxyacid dehydrogenase n=1 Tax=Marinobacterium rhizophilum TaxID=420402 RepID=UPI00037203D1|nr:D-glycerate dehydrogenase [Marinobacterium rhizophilum]